MKRLDVLLLVLASVFGAQVMVAEEPACFQDVTERAGISFRYTFGDFTYDNIFESSGSGVTIFDYDGDGDLDLYMLSGTYLARDQRPKRTVFATRLTAVSK